MTYGEAEKMLQKALLHTLQPLGFVERIPMCFSRERENRSEILNFGGRMHQGICRFSFVVGIRFPPVEAILRPENMDLTYPTIAAPIHFLHSDRRCVEWMFSDVDELAKAVESVVEDIEISAQKFFQHFYSLEVVEHDLRLGIEGADWHMLGKEQIIEVMAAIAKLGGRIHEARQIVEDALADPMNNKPAKRRRLESLRKNILE